MAGRLWVALNSCEIFCRLWATVHRITLSYVGDIVVCSVPLPMSCSVPDISAIRQSRILNVSPKEFRGKDPRIFGHVFENGPIPIMRQIFAKIGRGDSENHVKKNSSSRSRINA